MPIKNWKTTASDNNATPPYGAPEGMQKASVNNVMRQIMADVRAYAEQGGWFDWGHTATYIDTKTFSVPGDVTAIYTADRRLKISLSGQEVYANVNKTSIDGNITKITITEPVIDNTIAEVYIGFEPKAVSHYVGNQDLCFVTTTNNGNTLKLQPVSGILSNPLYDGTELRFFADTNNTGNVTLNGKPLRYGLGTSKLELSKDFISSGNEYRVKWDKASDQWLVIKGLTVEGIKGTSFIVSLDNGKFFTRKSDGSLPNGVDSTKIWSLADQKTNPTQPTDKTFIELPKGTVIFEDIAGDSSSTARHPTTVSKRGHVIGYGTATRTSNAENPEDAFMPTKKGTHGTIKDSAGTDLLLGVGAVTKRTDKATSWHPTFNIESKTISVVLTDDKILDYTIGKAAARDRNVLIFKFIAKAAGKPDYHYEDRDPVYNEAGKFDGYIVVSYE